MKLRLSRKTGWLIAAVVVLLAAGVGYAYFHHSHSPTTVVTVGKSISYPKTSSSSPPAKKMPPSSTSGTSNSGGATDTHGTASSTNSSQWVVSASGAVTVKQPAANSKLQDGSTISGSASGSQVNYRLSDNKVGVVAQGTLSVVNGSFSGVLHFQPQGTGGRLDVFTTDSKGVEYNEVQINVSF